MKASKPIHKKSLTILLSLSGMLAVAVAQNSTTFRGQVGGQFKTWIISHNGPAAADDADRNGLKDSWEIQHFGHTGVDPAGDPDKDGRTNAQEQAAGSSPTDFFNGEKPVLVTISGAEQQKASGYLQQPAVIQVYHADGSTPWPGAPVQFAVQSGFGRWGAAPGNPPLAQIIVEANNSGQARAYYWMP